ncbi:phage tail sheath family protein [Calidithermus chliarophilus]|uniref:phage tail sheath family protein n=1 Tax=Calidithermus chliarophilus TaxID=52023 RepID=UPI0003F79E7D|nr:phage tail sheath subtilisin-like domain-containing protein [Calidithermus chliarophilus]
MPEYLSPGVYVEEVNTGPRPIEGVGTAMAAFVGFAPAGPANKPQLITSWQQYVETFGALEDGVRNPHMPGAYLSHAVYGYFNNGGNRCYVTRVVPNTTRNGAVAQPALAQLPSRVSKAVPSLTLGAKGRPSSDIVVEVTPPSAEDAGEGAFNLRVKMDALEESFENVVVGRPAKGAKATALAEALKTSTLIELVEEKTAGALAERAPEVGSYVIKAGQPTEALAVKADSFVGNVDDRSGLEGLEIAEDVTMVAIPDLMSAYRMGMIDREGVKAVQLALIAHCERMQDRLAILDPLPDMTPQEVKRWREKEANFDSKFAVLYYPWIKVAMPGGEPTAVPPSGHVAGIWARNDRERGVHKAPANEIIRGALGPALEITKGEQDTLNPVGINAIRSFTGRGVRVWGARTLSSDPAWRYVNVRRLFNYVMKSVERGTQWVVFEPNDVNLWERVKRDITAFLTTVWREGALFGSTPNEAFYVKCDAELNTPEVRDQGQLIVEIGIAPVKPAEFVIFRFSQMTSGQQG